MAQVTAPHSLPAQEAAEAFIQKMGDTTGKVRVVDPRWRDYLTECACVTVHCSRMRAETLLTPDVLGIIIEDEAQGRALDNVVQLGYQLSQPKRIKLRGQQLENKFRAIHRKYALDTQMGRIISAKNYPIFLKEAEAVRAEYLNWAQWVYENWDALLEETSQDLTILGNKNFLALWRAGKPDLVPSDREQWVKRFVKRCLRKVGTKDQWLAQAKMSWKVGYIPLEAQLNRTTGQAEPQNALQAAVMADAANQLQSGLFDFMAQCRGALSNLIIEVMEDCLNAFQNNGGSVNRASARRLKFLAGKIDGLMFWDDQSLTRQMDEIVSHLEVKPESRDDERLGKLMQQLASEARSLLVELDVPRAKKSRNADVEDDFSTVGKNRNSRQAGEWDAESLTIGRAAKRQTAADVEV